MDIVWGALAKKVASVFPYWYQASRRLGEWGKKRGRYSLSPLAWYPSRSFIQISFYIACVVRAKRGGEGTKKWREVFLLVLLSSKSSSFFLSSTTPFDVCYAGVIYSTLAAKITNRDIMSFGAVWLLIPYLYGSKRKQSTLLICALVRLVVTPWLFFFNNLLRHSTGRLEKA